MTLEEQAIGISQTEIAKPESIPNVVYSETQANPNHPDRNEDTVLVTKHGAAVFDGMGGGLRGDLASQCAAAHTEGVYGLIDTIMQGETPDLETLVVPKFPEASAESQQKLATKYKESVSWLVQTAIRNKNAGTAPLRADEIVIALQHIISGVGEQIPILVSDYVSTLQEADQPKNTDMASTASIVYIAENPPTGFFVDVDMSSWDAIDKPRPKKDGEAKYAIIANVGNSRISIFNRNTGEYRQITLDADSSMMDPYGEVIPFRSESGIKKVIELQSKLTNTADLSILPEEERQRLQALGVKDLSTLSKNEKSIYKSRNKLSAGINIAVNGQPNVQAMYELELQPGDEILILTDGITHQLTNLEIADICRRSPDQSQITRLLKEQANTRVQQFNEHLVATGAKKDPSRVEGADDISVVLVDPFPSQNVQQETKQDTSADLWGQYQTKKAADEQRVKYYSQYIK